FLVGYNSTNYDTTVLSLYLWEAFGNTGPARQKGLDEMAWFEPVKPSTIREYNDEIFNRFMTYMPAMLVEGSVAHNGWESTPNKIRRSMLNSGRHIDAARFNESQQKVALKRLLGGMGRQILESDQLGGHNASLANLDDPIAGMYDLLAYNVSDVVGLEQLFRHETYSSGFDLKRGLMAEYPEVIYNRKPGTQKPDIRPEAVRFDRLTPDSTSAKFVGLILAP